jgi:hypothetical protein
LQLSFHQYSTSISTSLSFGSGARGVSEPVEAKGLIIRPHKALLLVTGQITCVHISNFQCLNISENLTIFVAQFRTVNEIVRLSKHQGRWPIRREKTSSVRWRNKPHTCETLSFNISEPDKMQRKACYCLRHGVRIGSAVHSACHSMENWAFTGG